VIGRGFGKALLDNGGGFFLLYVIQAACLSNGAGLLLLPRLAYRTGDWLFGRCCAGEERSQPSRSVCCESHVQSTPDNNHPYVWYGTRPVWSDFPFWFA
jgi:hypothetical protein